MSHVMDPYAGEADDSARVELFGPDTDGLYTSQLHDWIPLCPELSDSALRLYWIMRSLVIEKYGPVRKLTILQLAYLLPKKAVGPGEKPQPSSMSRIRNLLRELSAVVLISTPEGKPVTTSSRANAASAPLRIRLYDKPRPGYTGPRNAFAHLDAIRPTAERATRDAIEREARERAARRAGQNSDPLPLESEAGQNSDPLGQNSDPLGQNSDPLSDADLRERDLPFSPPVHTSRSFPGGSLRPSVSVGDAGGSATDGGTDGGGSVVEDQEQPAAAADPGGKSDTSSSKREVTPGEQLLRRIGRYHPEISAGLAMGSTLADQSRLVDGLLLSGVTGEEIRSVLIDRPYPAPAERTHTMASLIAGRLAKIVPPPLGYSGRLPAQATVAQASADRTPAASVLPLHRPCQGEIGRTYCDRLALPGTDLCARCTRAAAAIGLEGPEVWQQVVAATVTAAQTAEAQ
ncbi:hypothetical protein ABZV29_41820 [Streptomyces sp. NPDC005236]|uniref:hypothetical protein n=1 Tax=Streptomyces sp. NPDC005236 TaxID=3157028 RepID=UPI0033BE55E8